MLERESNVKPDTQVQPWSWKGYAAIVAIGGRGNGGARAAAGLRSFEQQMELCWNPAGAQRVNCR